MILFFLKYLLHQVSKLHKTAKKNLDQWRIANFAEKKIKDITQDFILPQNTTTENELVPDTETAEEPSDDIDKKNVN